MQVHPSPQLNKIKFAVDFFKLVDFNQIILIPLFFILKFSHLLNRFLFGWVTVCKTQELEGERILFLISRSLQSSCKHVANNHSAMSYLVWGTLA